MKIAAFDIGGTALKMGVMARDGRLLETARQSINDSDIKCRNLHSSLS